jgi:hypothetical protein
LKNTFISQHNLPVHLGMCPIISQAPENQHKIFWTAVGTRWLLPFHRYHDERHDMLAQIVTDE